MNTADDAVKQLDELDVSDPEWAHGHADEILLATVRADVAAAYERLQERCEWWACS